MRRVAVAIALSLLCLPLSASMENDGAWAAGVWATTVWADGVWFEGDGTPPAPTPGSGSGGGSGVIELGGLEL